jgi:hypothetical protein
VTRNHIEVICLGNSFMNTFLVYPISKLSYWIVILSDFFFIIKTNFCYMIYLTFFDIQLLIITLWYFQTFLRQSNFKIPKSSIAINKTSKLYISLDGIEIKKHLKTPMRYPEAIVFCVEMVLLVVFYGV